MGFESLIGNALAWLLKNKFAGFATKSIPAALFLWNTFYVMLRTYDPTLINAMPDAQGAGFSPVGYFVGYDSLFVNASWFGSLGGLFVTATQETAKQMFLHSVGKNTVAQWAIPMLYKAFKKR